MRGGGVISAADFRDVLGIEEPAIVAHYRPLVAVRKAPLEPLHEEAKWTSAAVEVVMPELERELVLA
jgi:hypothetical protein